VKPLRKQTSRGKKERENAESTADGIVVSRRDRVTVLEQSGEKIQRYLSHNKLEQGTKAWSKRKKAVKR
jgi:hypothetical protein